MFELFLFASISPSEFLDGKTECSYSFQPIYITIFKSHLKFNNFCSWRIFFTFLIMKLFCILYSCRKRIYLKRWQHAKQSGKERIWVVVCVFHYTNEMNGSVLTKSGFRLLGRRPAYCSLQGKGFFSSTLPDLFWNFLGPVSGGKDPVREYDYPRVLECVEA